MRSACYSSRRIRGQSSCKREGATWYTLMTSVKKRQRQEDLWGPQGNLPSLIDSKPQGLVRDQVSQNEEDRA